MALCKATLHIFVTDPDGTTHNLFVAKTEGQEPTFLSQGDEVKCVRRLQLILGAALAKLDTNGALSPYPQPPVKYVDKTPDVE